MTAVLPAQPEGLERRLLLDVVHEANGGDLEKVAEGANYLQVCDSAKGRYADLAAAFAEGIRAVLSGRRESFEMEYPCHGAGRERWFVLRANRFRGDGAVREIERSSAGTRA